MGCMGQDKLAPAEQEWGLYEPHLDIWYWRDFSNVSWPHAKVQPSTSRTNCHHPKRVAFFSCTIYFIYGPICVVPPLVMSWSFNFGVKFCLVFLLVLTSHQFGDQSQRRFFFVFSFDPPCLQEELNKRRCIPLRKLKHWRKSGQKTRKSNFRRCFFNNKKFFYAK